MSKIEQMNLRTTHSALPLWFGTFGLRKPPVGTHKPNFKAIKGWFSSTNMNYTTFTTKCCHHKSHIRIQGVSV